MPRPSPPQAPETTRDSLYRPDRFEIRAGGYYHCCFVESGSTALGLEVVAPHWIKQTVLPEFLIPRLHAGGVMDFNGRTSYGYAGFLFTFNFTGRIFLEPFVGIAVSNGVAKATPAITPSAAPRLFIAEVTSAIASIQTGA